MKGFKDDNWHLELHLKYSLHINSQYSLHIMCRIVAIIYYPCSHILYQLRHLNAVQGQLCIVQTENHSIIMNDCEPGLPFQEQAQLEHSI